MYDSIIEKFKNKGYFDKFFTKINTQRDLINMELKKSKASEEKTVCTAFIFLSLLCFIGVFSITSHPDGLITRLFGSLLSTAFVVVLLTPLVSVFSTIYRIYSKYEKKIEIYSENLRALESQLFKDLQNDKSLLQDLASLVVDEKTQEIFYKLTDELVNDKHYIAFKHIENLFQKYSHHYNCFQEKEKVSKFINKQEIYFKNMNKVNEKEMYQL